MCAGADHTVVNDVCRTRWIARLDAFNNFCHLFPAILAAIETTAKNVDGKYSRSNVEKAKPLFIGACQFQIIVIVVIVKKSYHIQEVLPRSCKISTEIQPK